MRVVAEIPHPECKITIFSWNNRYLIKLELGLLEQTFKINQFDIASEQELYSILDDNFIQAAVQRFGEMHQCLRAALEK